MSDFEKLINASDLIKWIVVTCPDWYRGAIRDIYDHIIEMPSAELIRCKDCKRARKSKYFAGEYNCRVMPDSGQSGEDYCSYAERRTDETV